MLSKTKVALGMSGGVDSSLAAHLLLEQGFDVMGVFLECWRAPGCRSEEDRADALKVALSLNIPFQVLDFKQAYKDKVVENFFAEYEAGRTPNPDVLCNKEIKFGLFYNWAMAHGFEYVATGHYAQVLHTQPVGRAAQYHLQTAVDAHKDQTYFLYRLRADQLPHVMFPVGHLTKAQVRQQAQQRQVHVSNKKDSVGICFIGDINVHGFLKDRLGENPGQVVDAKGNVIGTHKGLWFYTIGQRHGFTLNQTALVADDSGGEVTKHVIPPFYVIAKESDKNQLVVGYGSETYQSSFQIRDLHLISQEVFDEQKITDVLVRIRHTGELLSATFDSSSKIVKLSQPIQGIAEGQSAVFYTEVDKKLCCVGGGEIH